MGANMCGARRLWHKLVSFNIFVYLLHMIYMYIYITGICISIVLDLYHRAYLLSILVRSESHVRQPFKIHDV